MEKRFSEKFKCIQSDCDGHGCIPEQIADGEWEAQQCQFHAEYLFPIKEFIKQEITLALEAQREEIEKEVMAAVPTEHTSLCSMHFKGNYNCAICRVSMDYNECRKDTLKALQDLFKGKTVKALLNSTKI